MRFLLLITVIMAAGLVAGVMAGKALAGTSRPPESGAPPDIGEVVFPVGASPRWEQAVRSIDGLERAKVPLQSGERAVSPSEAQPQLQQESSPGESLRSISGHSSAGAPLIGVELSPLPGPLGTSDIQFFQASRQVPSALTVSPVALGDVNLDGVVNTVDLLPGEPGDTYHFEGDRRDGTVQRRPGGVVRPGEDETGDNPEPPGAEP